MLTSNRRLEAKTRYGAARGVSRLRICLLLFNFYFLIFNFHVFAGQPLVNSVETIGMTVSDMDRSVEFFSKVLSFEKVSDVEVAGREYEQLQGVFGLRMRVVRMKLGDEFIDLTEYLAPQGRPIPVDSRSNDRWFQHIAIVVSDMDRLIRSCGRTKSSMLPLDPRPFPHPT